MYKQIHYKIVETMEQHGSSFIKALAQCFRHADKDNFLILTCSFNEYWEQYRKMSGYIVCDPCQGDGYTIGHAPQETHTPDQDGDPECTECPIQIPCVICNGEGIMSVDEVLGKK